MSAFSVRGIRPGQPVTDFAVAPYPGERPAGSWVVDADQRLFPLRPDDAAESGWRVIGQDAEPGPCLDDWLVDNGGAPMAARTPVLSYGSNANPQKVVHNGASLPAVSLACDVEDLAAVWCHDDRDIRRLPATLVAWPGGHERHALTYLTAGDFAPLDVVEGRADDRYRLVALTAGRIVREDGVVPDRVLSYVGGRSHRLPLVDREGTAVRLTAVGHAAALRAVHDDRYRPGDLPELGPELADPAGVHARASDPSGMLAPRSDGG